MRTCLKRILVTTSLAALSLSFNAQARADDESSKTIIDIVVQSGGEFDRNYHDYDILLNAVLAAGLEDALADPTADLTVFAPNDRAFIRLARDLGYSGHKEEDAFNAIVAALTDLGGGDPIPLLTNVLLYHVSPGAKNLRTIGESISVDTLLDGATITPNFIALVDNEPDVKNARYTRPLNVKASNGVIQTINRVLLPLDIPGNTVEPTLNIVEIVSASEGTFDSNDRDFDILLQAVLAANLVEPLAAADADLTVFAPYDAAFIRLARDLGYDGHDEEGAFNAIVEALTTLGSGDPIPLLTNILLYHVSPGAKTVKQVADFDEITTLLADAVLQPWGVILVDGAPQLRSPKMRVSTSNIGATNGIIHILNRVLIPLDVAPAKH